jgi:hypothetical protein
MLIGIPWSRSPGERFGDGDWVMAILRPESFVLFCFVLIQTLLGGLKGLCRTKKTQILSSWTKPPFEAPGFTFPPVPESLVRGKGRLKLLFE